MQYDENKLISSMENFSGAKFQWIKTNKPELLGKVVTCRTIEPRGNQFFAIFDDGSTVNTNQLNTSLLMLHGDMQPLSRAEVESISGLNRPQPSQSRRPNMENSAESTNPEPRHFQPTQNQTNVFEMFNSDERLIDLKIKISLPDQDFLKMMYTNAKDKEKFLGELSDYMFKSINKKVIQQAISSMINPNQKEKINNTGTIVNITEIHED
jgi:hypothetical protein